MWRLWAQRKVVEQPENSQGTAELVEAQCRNCGDCWLLCKASEHVVAVVAKDIAVAGLSPTSA